MSVWKDTIKNTPLKSNLRPSWDPLRITSKTIKFGKTELAEQNKQRTDTQCLICQLGAHSFDIKIKMAKTFCSYWKFLLYFENRSQIWKSTCFVAIFLAYFFSVFNIWKFHFLVCNPFKLSNNIGENKTFGSIHFLNNCLIKKYNQKHKKFSIRANVFAILILTSKKCVPSWHIKQRACFFCFLCSANSFLPTVLLCCNFGSDA